MVDGTDGGRDSDERSTASPRRRRLLASVGAIGASGLAGCYDGDSDGGTRTTNRASPRPTETETPVRTDRADPDGTENRAARDYHHIDDYGADPTGEEPADDALEAAADAADPRDWILATNGEYRFEEYHTFREPYTIDADGSTLECTQYNGSKTSFKQSALHDSYEAVFHFRGTLEESTAIASGASEGDDQLVVREPSLFEPGDDVVVGTLSPGSRAYEPTRSVVRAVVDDTLHLHTPLKYDYDESTTAMSDDVTRIDAVVRPRVRNARFTGDAGCHVSFEYTREALMEHCVSDGYRQHSYQVVDGLDTVWRECRARDPLNLHGSHGEPFRIVGSSDVHLVRPVVDGCRRGIDLRSGCKTLRVLDPRIRGATLHGICYHNGDQAVAGDIHVSGGQVSCRLTDTTLRDSPNEVQTGWGVSTSSRGEVRLEDVDVVGRRRALSAAGGGEQTVSARNCTFATTGDDGSAEVVEIDAARVVMDDVRIRNDGVPKPRALAISGESVTVSGTISGDYGQSVVAVRDARDVALDLDIEGWSEPSVPGVRIDGTSDPDLPVENVHLAGAIRGPGSAVAVAGPNVRGVSIERLDASVDSGPAIAVSPGGDASAAENIRILDCDVTGGEAADVVVDGPVDGLWIANTVCGSIQPGGHENEFVRDNKTA